MTLQLYRDPIYQAYCSNYLIWKSDGERFLTESFINQYKEKQSVPLLNDGRPEFSEWLYHYTIGSDLFTSGWAYTIFRPFFHNMYVLYKQNDMPLECVNKVGKALIYLMDEDEY